MNLVAEVTVAAIVERRGEYLVVEESIDGQVVFNQPAGHVEVGETLVEAVVRETLEETAFDFAPSSLLGAYLWTSPASAKITLRFAFIGAVTTHHSARALDQPIIAAHWLSHDQLIGRASQMRSPLVLRCIDDYLRGRRLPLDTVACLDLEVASRVPGRNG